MNEVEKLTVEETLSHYGKYVGPTVGVSMQPMLKNRRDTVVILAKTHRLQPLDVALYKRGNAYVLHRVLSVTEEGYVIRGDNCYADEVVFEEDVIGVLSEFFRKNKHYTCQDKKYLAYAKRRIKNYKLRRPFALCKMRFIGAIKTIFHRKSS